MMKQTSFVKDDATFPALDQPLTLSEMSDKYYTIPDVQFSFRN